MKFTEEFLRKAHKHSIFHHSEIMDSDLCCCFYCQSNFEPEKIIDWCDEDDLSGKTALCPNCGIDSVIGSKSGYPITDEDFIEEMHRFWFN